MMRPCWSRLRSCWRWSHWPQDSSRLIALPRSIRCRRCTTSDLRKNGERYFSCTLGTLRRDSQRQRKKERTAFAQFAIDPYFSAVGFDDSLGNRQAQAQSIVFRLQCLPVAIEDFRYVFSRDTWSPI